MNPKNDHNMLGAYGHWFADNLAQLDLKNSFLSSHWTDVSSWKKQARSRFLKSLLIPEALSRYHIKERIISRYEYQDLSVEELAWQLPYGPETHAIFLKPSGVTKKLPGILALHDHGANKYFGKRKIVKTSDKSHPCILNYQETYYGGVAWANELARQGYAVLVHDVFPFGSRRILASDLPAHVVRRIVTSPEDVEELTPDDLNFGETTYGYDVSEDENVMEIRNYNTFASRHEEIIARSLFSAGTTLPGIFVYEDRVALDYLCSREDVDSRKTGICGLSGGGLRANYLASLEDCISCSVSVGFLTTWNDFLLNNSYTASWMTYIPGLPQLMDFPDILSMRAPLPAMVISTDNDPLYNLVEVQKAARKLEHIYSKSGASDHFRFSLFPGSHKFDLPMQNVAFEWLNQWLK